jgi:hypothetical protein
MRPNACCSGSGKVIAVKVSDSWRTMFTTLNRITCLFPFPFPFPFLLLLLFRFPFPFPFPFLFLYHVFDSLTFYLVVAVAGDPSCVPYPKIQFRTIEQNSLWTSLMFVKQKKSTTPSMKIHPVES